MPRFADADALEEFLGRPVNQSQANRVLDMVSARIRASTDQLFDYIEDDIITLPGGRRIITLPQQPVRSVSAVTTHSLGATASMDQVAGVGYRVMAGDLVWIGGGYPRLNASPAYPYLGHVWPDEVTATYSHGYDLYPEDVVGCALMLAAELITSPEGDTFERIDDYARRRPDAADTMANQALKEVVKRYGRGVYAVGAR